ncbi:MAG: protein deglycase HchA, partial [Candidatus Electrothrix sp. ATG2]|nr:protein deglycase HchA [Candidatus Electrothrix sp. ATG2]
SGKKAVLEMWAFPEKDKHVNTIYNEYKARLEQPLSLQAFSDNSLADPDSYAAVFVPGGHGSMLGIPEDENVGKILHWAHENGVYTITLCHGPGALLATMLNDQKFLYKGYNMAVFPDAVDKQTAMIGYLPGKMPWGLSEKLEGLGGKLMNTKADDTVCLDRKLITGASPLAANALGKLAAETLLSVVR